MDSSVLRKLRISQYRRVLLLNPPQTFASLLKDFAGVVDSHVNGRYGYVQIFITSQAEMTENGPALANAIEGDGWLWICYPKGTSKKYQPDCNRDTLREALKDYGFEGVALVSLDEDWSALRLRNTKYSVRRAAP